MSDLDIERIEKHASLTFCDPCAGRGYLGKCDGVSVQCVVCKGTGSAPCDPDPDTAAMLAEIRKLRRERDYYRAALHLIGGSQDNVQRRATKAHIARTALKLEDLGPLTGIPPEIPFHGLLRIKG